MQTGLKIGHDTQCVTDVGDLIRYIIDAPTGECVKLAALEAMKETLSLTGLSLQNVTIGDKTHNYYGEQADAGEETND